MRQDCLLPVCAVYLTLPPAFVKGSLSLSLSLSLSCAVFVCSLACKRCLCQRQSNVHSTQAFPGAVTQKRKERKATEPGCVCLPGLPAIHFHFAYFLKCLPTANASYTQSAAACCKHKKGNQTINSTAAIRNELLAEVGIAEPDAGR